MNKRPNRDQLNGLSLSQLRTLLKRRGHKVPRKIYYLGYVTQFRNRLYRFRWWTDKNFVVDISCPLSDFDRWANSCDETVSFDTWRSR